MEKIKMMMIQVRMRKLNKIINLFYKEWQDMSFLDAEDLQRDDNSIFLLILHSKYK